MNYLILFGGVSMNYPQTILNQFIRDQLEAHQEPVREGKQPGEKKGFPRHKLEAAVMMMTSMELKDICSHVDISYSLLTKWRTEDDFKNKIEELTRDLSKIIFDYFIEQLRGEGNKKQSFYRVVDNDKYSKRLFEAITVRVKDFVCSEKYQEEEHSFSPFPRVEYGMAYSIGNFQARLINTITRMALAKKEGEEERNLFLKTLFAMNHVIPHKFLRI